MVHQEQMAVLVVLAVVVALLVATVEATAQLVEAPMEEKGKEVTLGNLAKQAATYTLVVAVVTIKAGPTLTLVALVVEVLQLIPAQAKAVLLTQVVAAVRPLAHRLAMEVPVL